MWPTKETMIREEACIEGCLEKRVTCKSVKLICSVLHKVLLCLVALSSYEFSVCICNQHMYFKCQYSIANTLMILGTLMSESSASAKTSVFFSCSY